MTEGEPKFKDENQGRAETVQPVVDEKAEAVVFPDEVTDAYIKAYNKGLELAGLATVRKATEEEKVLLDAGKKAVDSQPGKKYTPALLAKSGKIYRGKTHQIAYGPASKAGEIVVKRGWADKDGNFLTLLDVARLEMKEKNK